MSTTTGNDTLTVALVGNPNTGKSTLFCALAGIHQHVANYPGVTVEKRVGTTQYQGQTLTLIDLPGTYSLAPRSLDERVAVEVCLGLQPGVERPDVIVCVAHAGNLERHLYLVSQILQLGRPVVLALNMADVARERGIQVDGQELAHRLGIAVVTTEAHRAVGIDSLQQAVIEAAATAATACPSPLPAEFQREVARFRRDWADAGYGDVDAFLAERWILDVDEVLQTTVPPKARESWSALVNAARQRLDAEGVGLLEVETSARYAWVDRTIEGLIDRSPTERFSWTDRIDAVLTHPVVGTLLFLAVMLVVFQSIFSWSAPLQDGIELLTTWVGSQLLGWLPEGMVKSLLTNGVVAGVGAVLAFVPQIATLFLFIALLEDCGYMARAAYLMDRLMARVGLSGKSFIPLISSFACAVPGIMATRVIENRRDRLVTILVAPLMSCSARLPIYTLLIAAFIPRRSVLGGVVGLPALTLFLLYLLGVLVAIGMARLLKHSLLKGRTPPFLLELPDYRLPAPRVVIARVAEQVGAFVRSAGTLILAVTVLVWAMAYFPHAPEIEQQVRRQFAPQQARLKAELAQADPVAVEAIAQRRRQLEQKVENHVAGAYMQQSWLGRAGRLIAPLVRPLGWDWRIGCAVIASFPAREVVIGSMGVIYNLGEGHDESSGSLQQKLKRVTWPDTDRPVFTTPVALSLMVFYALCAQCAATLVVIRRETGSPWWSWFTFGYMTALAYAGAFVTYQLGHWLGTG